MLLTLRSQKSDISKRLYYLYMGFSRQEYWSGLPLQQSGNGELKKVNISHHLQHMQNVRNQVIFTKRNSRVEINFSQKPTVSRKLILQNRESLLHNICCIYDNSSVFAFIIFHLYLTTGFYLLLHSLCSTLDLPQNISQSYRHNNLLTSTM